MHQIVAIWPEWPHHQPKCQSPKEDVGPLKLRKGDYLHDLMADDNKIIGRIKR